MKTISLSGPGSINIIEQESDAVFSKMALLRIISSGICAADSYLWSGNHPWSIVYPIVPGHEIFGEVIEVRKEDAFNFPIGTKVAVQVNVPCYECEPCLKNRFNMCTARNHFGSTFKGSFAEEMAIPLGARMHPYSEPIDDSIGGLTETMANAIYCSRKINFKSDESVLILGMGSIGACLAHYLKSTYPSLKLSVLTSSEIKKIKLQELGIVSKTLEDLENDRDSFDIIFETSGYSINFAAGLVALKPLGFAIIYGVFQDKMLFDFNQVSEFKELTLIGGHLADDESFKLAINFLTTKQGELGYLISNIVGFSNFATSFSNPKFSLFKTIFQPTHQTGSQNGI